MVTFSLNLRLSVLMLVLQLMVVLNIKTLSHVNNVSKVSIYLKRNVSSITYSINVMYSLQNRKILVIHVLKKVYFQTQFLTVLNQKMKTKNNSQDVNNLIKTSNVLNVRQIKYLKREMQKILKIVLIRKDVYEQKMMKILMFVLNVQTIIYYIMIIVLEHSLILIVQLDLLLIVPVLIINFQVLFLVSYVINKNILRQLRLLPFIVVFLLLLELLFFIVFTMILKITYMLVESVEERMQTYKIQKIHLVLKWI